jgi:hypothetical protein
MADPHPPHTANAAHGTQDHAALHHEESDANIGAVLAFGAGLIVVCALASLLVFVIFRFFDAREAHGVPVEYPLDIGQRDRVPPEPQPPPELEIPKLAPSPAPHPAVTLRAPQPKPKVKQIERPPVTQRQPEPAASPPPTPTPQSTVSQGAATSASSVRVTWQAQLLAWLEKYKHYPRVAQEQRQQGVVYLRLIDRGEGSVLPDQQELRRFELLDDEVLALIQRAQPQWCPLPHPRWCRGTA